jgi:hypothetical protein
MRQERIADDPDERMTGSDAKRWWEREGLGTESVSRRERQLSEPRQVRTTQASPKR